MQIPEELIGRAVSIIKSGGLVAFPTDTVYCLGADPFNPEAVARVFEVKKRPLDMPLSILVADMQQLHKICHISPFGLFLTEEFFPGGLTIIMPSLTDLPSLVTAGKNSIGVRIPRHPIALAIISKLEKGVIGTSANIHGQKSPITGTEVEEQLDGNVNLIIDGTCPGGIESTSVDITSGKIEVIREGAISAKKIYKAYKKFRRSNKAEF